MSEHRSVVHQSEHQSEAEERSSINTSVVHP